MKIILANNKELDVKRVMKNITFSNGNNSTNVTISFSKNYTIEELVEELTPDNVSAINIIRDGEENKILERYTIQSIMEDINDENNIITCTLIKE